MTASDVTTPSIPLQLLHEDDFEQWRAAQDEPVRNWAATYSFKAERNKLLLVPGPQGRPVAVIVGLAMIDAIIVVERVVVSGLLLLRVGCGTGV